MLRKYITIIFLASLTLVGCQDNKIEEVFQKNASEIQSERLQDFNTELKKNDQWLASMYTETGKKTYFLKIQFKDKGRTVMCSASKDISTGEESSYTLRYTQQEDLIFDSHSYMALHVDVGLKADFRWSVQEQTDNYILFKSRADGSEGKSFLRIEKYSDELYSSKKKLKNDESISLFRNIEMEGSEVRYGFAYNNALNKASITKWEEENQREITTVVDADVTDKEIIFTEPVVIEGNKFSKFTLGADGNYVSDEGGKKAYIRYSGYSPVMQTGAEFIFAKQFTYAYCSIETSDYTKTSPSYIDELLKLQNKKINVSYLRFYNSQKYGIYIKIKSSLGNSFVDFKIEDKELGRKVLTPTTPIPDDFKDILAPFFDAKGVYFIDKGSYITAAGKVYGGNNSVQIVSVTDPSYQGYAYTYSK
ncbi:DUF4302 domain-containing protein [Halosquirtibacter xylanolyticus]|uniref:DUF4302 domain-containing protein n=1 Tax=Halosquirtibacter xylanolyticus TaxID=3374599 RepID=UPI0037490115|nr:DUF4302 domain-containing protein [Prolixibacteraceae bacterium]